MYILATKLKKVKASLKELNRTGFTDIQAVDLKAYHGMIEAQEDMHSNPTDQGLVDLELQEIHEYKIKHKAYLEFLRQKTKLEWIKAGEENATLFYQSINSRNLQNQVYKFFDMEGVWRDKPSEVSEAFLSYYQVFFGGVHDHRTHVIQQVVQTGPVCQDHHKQS